MNYLFFDIECANCYGGRGKICSFGYVLTDENLNILEKEDIIINPRSSFNLGPDLKLAYTKAEFKEAFPFTAYYDHIGALLEYDDYVILGYSIENDANFLRSDCKRYDLPCYAFDFYDVQCMVMQIFGLKNMPSLQKALEFFGMSENQDIHKSDDDAYMTMLAMKGACDYLGITPAELIERYPIAKGRLEDYQITTAFREERERQRQEREAARRKEQAEVESNKMRFRSPNFYAFQRHLRRVNSASLKGGELEGQRICISSIYEKNHFRQMVRLTEQIGSMGGRYVQKASQANVFVKWDEVDEQGNPRKCKRRAFAEDAVANGAKIELISFDELLERLSLTAEALESETAVAELEADEADLLGGNEIELAVEEADGADESEVSEEAKEPLYETV